MRDIKLNTLDIDGVSCVDIDIIDGEPAYLDEASQTNDQRAALAVYACKGTMPSKLDFGVSWGALFDKSNTIIQLNNEMQQQIQDYVGSSSEDSSLPSTQYEPQLLLASDSLGVIIHRG